MTSDESEKEGKAIKTLLATSITVDQEEDECDRLLLKHSLWKFIRITCWISLFFNNCRPTKTKPAQASLGIVSSCVLKWKISQNLTNVYSFLKPHSFDIPDMKMKILGSSNLK